MEGIVAKRSLKKSYYKRNNVKDTNSFGTIFNKEQKLRRTKEDGKTKENIYLKYKNKLIYKISLQVIVAISILLFVLAVKVFNISIVKKAEITKKIVKTYKSTNSIKDIKNGFEKIVKNVYLFVNPVIPDNIEKIMKNSYKNIIKTINDSNNNGVIIYEENSDTNKENKKEDEQVNKDDFKEEIIGIGSSIEEENVNVTKASSVSVESDIVKKINETNVKFVKPVNGKVTSSFGAREVIFEGIDSYHTGVDIGANTGTAVYSSIEGSVTVATYNKYNGNYVEVTNGKIVTKYLHMSKIVVKKGVKVKAGQKIGEVDSTGLATGPHLHFEIVYDSVKINPELIVSI